MDARLALLEDLVADLQSRIATLEANSILQLAGYVRVEQGEINHLSGPHVIFEGANVHVQSGSGATDDNGASTGLGNFVVGYNERSLVFPNLRGGSHNVVVGPAHLYHSYGGLVAGKENMLYGPSSSVTGGSWNSSQGEATSVCGGYDNIAFGQFGAVLGGRTNRAIGADSTVSGGMQNVADGLRSSVSGGASNNAAGVYSSISGGEVNRADAQYSSISGGVMNLIQPEGYDASISGGRENTTRGRMSSISGGYQRALTDPYLNEYDWRAGGIWEDQ